MDGERILKVYRKLIIKLKSNENNKGEAIVSVFLKKKPEERKVNRKIKHLEEILGHNL